VLSDRSLLIEITVLGYYRLLAQFVRQATEQLAIDRKVFRILDRCQRGFLQRYGQKKFDDHRPIVTYVAREKHLVVGHPLGNKLLADTRHVSVLLCARSKKELLTQDATPLRSSCSHNPRQSTMESSDKSKVRLSVTSLQVRYLLPVVDN
jgi:hypothetical protein